MAHPSATDPERVIIRNEANGRFVIGALFRRERDNPGPALQVSSDAASALGLLAGAPSVLNVTALRREEVAEDIALATPAEGIAPPNYDGPDAGGAETIAALPLDGPASAASVAPAPAPSPTPVATSALERPFVQIGILRCKKMQITPRRPCEILDCSPPSMIRPPMAAVFGGWWSGLPRQLRSGPIIWTLHAGLASKMRIL